MSNRIYKNIAKAFIVSTSIITGTALAQSSQNNLIYQVFVRSFYDANQDSEGVGDIMGIVKQMDTYLNDGDPNTDYDLEVGIVWLMPIFPTRSYHGYDVRDFRAINPEYGTLDDFKMLLREAHKRGVRIIIDIPINHTSNDHPWFVEAINNQSSQFRDFYHITMLDCTKTHPWHGVENQAGQKLSYLGLFSPFMPDLHFNNSAVRDTIKAIAEFWLDMGVDGFRLDAAKHIYGDTFGRIPERDVLANNDWWLEFSHFVYTQNPNAVLVGEVLGNPELLRRHAYGLDALLDEPFMEALRTQVSFPANGFVGKHNNFVRGARDLNRRAYRSNLPFPDRGFHSFTFAASHDKNPRLASELEEKKRHGMVKSVDEAYRLAMYMLLTIDRHPIIYAGDEVMQRGWKWNGNSPSDPSDPGDGSGIYDETLREPFPWYKSGRGRGQTKWFPPRFDQENDGVSKEEQEETGGMLHLVRGLTNLRTRHPSLADGDIGAILTDSEEWLVFEKVMGADKYLVLINQTANGMKYRFHGGWFPEYSNAQLIYWSDGMAKKWRDTTFANKYIDSDVFVPPFGMGILRPR